jgi:hypothetical protein
MNTTATTVRINADSALQRIAHETGNPGDTFVSRAWFRRKLRELGLSSWDLLALREIGFDMPSPVTRGGKFLIDDIIKYRDEISWFTSMEPKRKREVVANEIVLGSKRDGAMCGPVFSYEIGIGCDLKVVKVDRDIALKIVDLSAYQWGKFEQLGMLPKPDISGRYSLSSLITLFSQLWNDDSFLKEVEF